jgi:hypothetical protein
VNKRYTIIFIISIFYSCLNAQIEFNGTLDLEAAMGGKDSQFITNEIANEFRNPHLAIHQFNLFAFAQVTDDFMVNTRIQFDTWGSGTLNPPKITLAVLTWEPAESSFSLSAGRYISPFGLYPRRILSADNLFTYAPLSYGYFINISDRRGFWPKAGNSGTYGPDDVGLTIVYFGGYNTGALFSWIIVPALLNIDIALTNAAIASQRDYTNQSNFGGIVRLGFQPVIYWQQGISVSHGSFMHKDGINSIYENLKDFSQSVIGTDLVLAHSYFELSGEVIYSMWQVPLFANADFSRQGSRTLKKYNLANYGAYMDFKIEPPFLTGAYIAVRYDILKFLDSDDLNDVNSKNHNPWDNDITRYSIAIGYKIARPVLLKIAYMDQKTKNVETDPEDQVIRAILTVSF